MLLNLKKKKTEKKTECKMALILTRQKRDKKELVKAMEIMVLESAEWMELRENKKNLITGHSLMTPRMNY